MSLLSGCAPSAVRDALGAQAEQHNEQEQRDAQGSEQPEGDVLVGRVDSRPLRGMVGHIR